MMLCEMEKNQEGHKNKVFRKWVVLNWSVKEGLITQKSKSKMVTENWNLKFLDKQNYILHRI